MRQRGGRLGRWPYGPDEDLAALPRLLQSAPTSGAGGVRQDRHRLPALDQRDHTVGRGGLPARRQRYHRDGHPVRYRPAGSVGGVLSRHRVGERLPLQEGLHQPRSQHVPLPLLTGVATGAGRRQHIDVDEDGLGQRDQVGGGNLRRDRPRRELFPGHARSDPVGRQQRLQAATLRTLDRTDAPVETRRPRVQRVGVGTEQVQQPTQRDLRAALDDGADLAVPGPGVGGDLLGDGVHGCFHQSWKHGSQGLGQGCG